MKRIVCALLALLFLLAGLPALGAEAAPEETEAPPVGTAAPDPVPPSETPPAAAPVKVTAETLLDALGEGPYRTVYETLSEEESILRNGSYGELAEGLQQTLLAFGQELEVDGAVGSITMGALNRVRASFGIEESDSLDAEGYAQLLPPLLILTDPEAAEELLSGSGDGHYAYLQACALEQQGLYGQAMTAFRESRWEDWRDRAAACVQEWPEDSQLWHSGQITGSELQLTVDVAAENEDTAMLVKVYTQRGELASCLFIGGSGSASVTLPSGTYIIKDGVGTDWFGMEDAFGPDGYYEVMTFEPDFQPEVTLTSGGRYRIYINRESSDPDVTGIGAEDETWSDF